MIVERDIDIIPRSGRILNSTDVRRCDSRIQTAIVSSYYESLVEVSFLIVLFLLYIQPLKIAVLIGILHHNLIEINKIL